VCEAKDAALQWIALTDPARSIALFVAIASSLQDEKQCCLQYAQLALAAKESELGSKSIELLPVLSLLIEVTKNLQIYDLCKQYSQHLIAIQEEVHLLVYRNYANPWFGTLASETATYYERLTSQNYETLAVYCQLLSNYQDTQQYFVTLFAIMQKNHLCIKLSQSAFEALVETKQALERKEGVADVCRNYVRKVIEREGEGSKQTLKALRIAQNTAKVALSCLKNSA